MPNNIFQQQITPVKPKVLANERVFVYVPKATTGAVGIASYNSRDFSVNNGQVSLIWPMQTQIEQLSNPLTQISRVKLLDDEFENTQNSVSLVNPVTGTTYNSSSAEVQLNRKNRNAFTRPDFVMLDSTSDFETSIDDNGYVKYTIQRNNPLDEPSLIKVDTNDFNRTEQEVVNINWPYAHNGSGTDRTNGFGLVKISNNSEGGLEFTNDGILSVNISKVAKIKPTYGADANTGFTNYDDFVGEDSYAKTDSYGYPLLSITKEAVGLSKVENKAFNEYTYNDLGQSFKDSIDSMLNLKLDKTTWNSLFNDWQPPTETRSTPQKWLTVLDNEDEAIWESLTSLRRFLGYFENLNALEAVYPPSNVLYGSTAFLLNYKTYWAIKAINVDYMIARDEDLQQFIIDNQTSLINGDRIGVNENTDIYVYNDGEATLISDKVQYDWYNTNVDAEVFNDYMETDATKFRPDGVASAGTSGMWAQSDHIHPTDLTRLSKDTYNQQTINITSDKSSEYDDFTFKLNSEISQIGVNIPYVLKSKGIHNWNGQTIFADSEGSTEQYWRGTRDEFSAQVDNIANNSLIIVDENEQTFTDAFVTANGLSNQGITIDEIYPLEKFVIVASDSVAQTLTNKPLTLETVTGTSGDTRYRLKAIDLPANRVVTTVTSNDKVTLSTKSFSGDTIVYGSDGELTSSLINKDSILVTDKNGVTNTLTSGRLLKSGSNNIVTTMDFGTTANKLIVTDGLGNITTKTNSGYTFPHLLQMNSNGTVAESFISTANIVITSENDNALVWSGESLVLTKNTRELKQFKTTSSKHKLIVGNGQGSIQESTLTAGKFVYTSDTGELSVLPMTEADAGKYLGVSSSGTPTLLNAPSITTASAITVYDTDPGNNTNGYVLCRLDAEPTSYSEGVLYLW